MLVPRAGPEIDDASEVNTAVLIDLPPALASSAPKREGADGSEQQASQASAAVSAPPPVEPLKPDHDPTPPMPNPPADVPPPLTPAPDPADIPIKKAEATPPRPAAAAPAPQKEEQAPAGADQPVKTQDTAGEEDRPHAAAHAMSLWQRSMVTRLETSKRALRRQAGREGTVVVAFAITRVGGLLSARVTRSSGDPALDTLAKALVERAAPFPAPPAGISAKGLSFTVPIRFKR